MYFVKTPAILRRTMPGALWRIDSERKEIFLTFDDGPHPVITPWILGILQKHHAKATFFCVGRNVEQYPAIYKSVLESGHAAGNHTFNHVNGWRTKTEDYLSDVAACAKFVASPLFRPPYGRISAGQYRALVKSCRMVMWDVLSGDFDTSIDGEKCISNVLDNVSPGSVVVFHDSEKAFPRLEPALPVILKRLREDGFEFSLIV